MEEPPGTSAIWRRTDGRPARTGKSHFGCTAPTTSQRLRPERRLRSELIAFTKLPEVWHDLLGEESSG
jgi:hypothetical protein